MALKIEYLDKNDLKPYANNAKIHTAEQVEQIKKSIREFGFNDPVAVWHDNEIVEGHGRLLAAMEMDEVQTIPVIRLDGLTDEQRKAYAIAHNKLTMNTDFDLDLLSLELDSIGDLDMTDFGFNEAEILELTIDDSPEEIHVPQAQARTEIPSEPQIGFSGVPAGGMNEPSYPSVEYAGSGSPIQEPTKDDLDFYSKKAEQTLARRVIIVYSTEEEERFLKGVLAQDAEKPLAVVLDVKNIMKAQARLNEKVSD